jgi:ABC-type uncharacterized transport system substrate-binding protein
MTLPRRRFVLLGGAGLAGQLLLASCGFGKRSEGPRPLIGVLQMVDAQPPNLTRLGFEQALAAAGYREGQNVSYLRRDAAGQLRRSITVVERPVANAGQVPQAAKALQEQGVEAFVKIGDYATIEAFAAICKVGLEHRIPVYSVDPPDIQLPGCLAVIGWNYRDDGMAAGRLAVRVLKGESPSQMAFQPLTSTDLLVSLATAQAIGVTVPEDLLKRADRVVR